MRRWLELWRDLRELQGAGAFALLTKENMLAQLCGALLRGGHFKLARSFLQVIAQGVGTMLITLQVQFFVVDFVSGPDTDFRSCRAATSSWPGFMQVNV